MENESIRIENCAIDKRGQRRQRSAFASIKFDQSLKVVHTDGLDIFILPANATVFARRLLQVADLYT